MYSKLDIWDYIEFLANTRVSSFYPMQVANALGLPLNEVIDELNNIVRSGSRITLQFEIRCDDCISILKSADDFKDCIGTEIHCEECGEYIEISKYNVYLLYKIDNHYREHVKKKRLPNTENKKEFKLPSTVSVKERLNIEQIETVLSRNTENKPVNLVVKDSIIYCQIGGSHMSGDQYNNNGQAGAMGPDAKVSGNTFNQNNVSGLDKIIISSEDIKNLESFIESINNQAPSDISKSDAMQASVHLQTLIEATNEQNCQVQEESIANWRQWMSKSGERSIKAIQVAANLVTIGMPLAQLLGIQIG